MDSEDEETLNRVSMITDQDRNVAALELKDRLRSLRACYNLMKQHGSALEYTITSFQPYIGSDEEQLADYLQMLSDRAILFGISSRAMLKTCSSYLESAEADSHRVFHMLQIERERSRNLEKALFETAKQHSALERKSRGVSLRVKSPSIESSSKPVSLNNSEEEDNIDNTEAELDGRETEPEPNELIEADSLTIIRKSIWQSNRARSTRKLTQFTIQEIVVPPMVPRKSTKQRRSRVPDRPNISVNAWSLLKNSIGKDLSKIPMPVNFNEPLSLLQRLTEEMEYAELLDQAVEIEDKSKQLAYVAAFAISAYATTSNRTAKPFNPLLNETYECDRSDDRGWRSIAEQVSHHPPISALYCEGNGWSCWQEISIKMKFKGKNLQIVPTGHSFCKFEKSGNIYTWNKANTIVNNIIVGKMWLDQQGEVEIKGLQSAADVSCVLTFVPFSIFSRETQRKVKGIVRNAKNVPKYAVQGYWDSSVEIAPIEPGARTTEPDKADFTTIWKRCLPEPGSEKYHCFSQFTCQLNELEEGVAPTDSRLRPDLRLMEQGLWDQSNIEKLRLEQQQRHKKSNSPRSSLDEKDNEKSADYIEAHEPMWFTRSTEKGKVIHTYNGLYWEAKKKKDWSRCPDIF